MTRKNLQGSLSDIDIHEMTVRCGMLKALLHYRPSGIAIRTPAEASLVLAAAKQAMHGLTARFEALHQSGKFLVAFDVMLVHHDAAYVAAVVAT